MVEKQFKFLKKMIMEATKHELQRCDMYDIIVQVTCVPYCVTHCIGNVGWHAASCLWRAYMGYRTVQA